MVSPEAFGVQQAADIAERLEPIGAGPPFDAAGTAAVSTVCRLGMVDLRSLGT